MSRPESSRNQYIYPEKQTPTDRLASRIQTAVDGFVDPEISDDDFDNLALTIKGIARRFIDELDIPTPPRVKKRKKKVNGNDNLDDDAIYGINVYEVPGGVIM